MSTAVLPPPQPIQILPRPFRWTCDEFHALGESGRFEGRRAMLVNGIILERGPMNPPQAICLELVVDRLRTIFATGWRVRVQLPLQLSQVTDPHPDVAVLMGNPRDVDAHPTTARLVVEISDSTLPFDCGEKANLYAAGGVLDYWVVDLVNRRLLAFRDPQPEPAEPHGHVYRQQLAFGPGDAVAPLAAPQSPVVVAELLP